MNYCWKQSAAQIIKLFIISSSLQRCLHRLFVDNSPNRNENKPECISHISWAPSNSPKTLLFSVLKSFFSARTKTQGVWNLLTGKHHLWDLFWSCFLHLQLEFTTENKDMTQRADCFFCSFLTNSTLLWTRACVIDRNLQALTSASDVSF